MRTGRRSRSERLGFDLAGRSRSASCIWRPSRCVASRATGARGPRTGPALARTRLVSPQERKRYADINKVARWFGILLAVSIGVWNREQSPFYCQEAHLLAIKDEEKQHRRLVRYYKSLGFKTLREEDELTFQDAVTWGGEGTLMNVDADDFMRQWTPVVRQLAGIQMPTPPK
ncbi:unnamed protein product [Prorocentrum cordatum]|uniref:Uncharacterized protein n=1 Tax=Prorocentrum cordatum TaxID=2364126 RepID=A0ABN9TKY1_9DINO|nr:unnamed protein product [Polarella glacialis]